MKFPARKTDRIFHFGGLILSRSCSELRKPLSGEGEEYLKGLKKKTLIVILLCSDLISTVTNVLFRAQRLGISKHGMQMAA